jgi:hypothetical protein
MKTKIGLLALFALCAAGSAVLAAGPGAHDNSAPIRLAQTAHAKICKANEDACLKACDGATSCSNQCVTNYTGCMSQEG